jgi:hypothetical protein
VSVEDVVSEIAEDVRRRIALQYAGESYFEVVRLLASTGLELQVVRSIVFLANGDFEQLLRYARCAEQDRRDVIFWAEYEDHDSTAPRKVRSMTEPFSDE